MRTGERIVLLRWVLAKEEECCRLLVLLLRMVEVCVAAGLRAADAVAGRAGDFTTLTELPFDGLHTYVSLLPFAALIVAIALRRVAAAAAAAAACAAMPVRFGRDGDREAAR